MSLLKLRSDDDLGRFSELDERRAGFFDQQHSRPRPVPARFDLPPPSPKHNNASPTAPHPAPPLKLFLVSNPAHRSGPRFERVESGLQR